VLPGSPSPQRVVLDYFGLPSTANPTASTANPTAPTAVPTAAPAAMAPGRCIIFTTLRETVAELRDVLAHHSPQLDVRCFVGQVGFAMEG
jgi:hypothetical protein